MTTLNATKVRQNFFDLIEKVDKTSTPLTITVNGEARVVMLSAEEFEGWIETLDILFDRELVKNIKKAKNQIKKGKQITLEKLKQKHNV